MGAPVSGRVWQSLLQEDHPPETVWTMSFAVASVSSTCGCSLDLAQQHGRASIAHDLWEASGLLKYVPSAMFNMEPRFCRGCTGAVAPESKNSPSCTLTHRTSHTCNITRHQIDTQILTLGSGRRSPSPAVCRRTRRCHSAGGSTLPGPDSPAA